MSSNCLVFHTSGGISSSPAAFLFLIFLRTESSSPCVNGPSLMSNCLLIILVISSCVIFGGFPSKFSKCCFHSFILFLLVCCFKFCFGCVLSSAHFVYCLPGNSRFVYLLPSLWSYLSDFECILSVPLYICLLIDIVPFLVLRHLCLLGFFDSFWRLFSLVHVFSLTAKVSHGTLYLVFNFLLECILLLPRGVHWRKFSYSSFGVLFFRLFL